MTAPITTENAHGFGKNVTWKQARDIAHALDSNYHKGWLDHGQRTMVAQAIRSEHHNTADVHYLPGIRRLTPIEAERLQGFPDDWTKYGLFEDGQVKEISDTQRYKCLGNAVSVPVVRCVAEKLLKAIEANK